MPSRQPTGDPGVEGAEATPGGMAQSSRERRRAMTTPTKRVRINVSTSVKGVKTYDVTVELTAEQSDGDLELEWQTIEVSDVLVAELDQRYPPGGVDA